MATSPRRVLVSLIATQKTASMALVSMDILELCRNTLARCEEQLDSTAEMMEENHTINKGNLNIKGRLALEKRRRRPREFRPI
jgi:hypothetical protein